MPLTLVVFSALVFVIINLPPGDSHSNQINELRATGQSSGVAKAEFPRIYYALDRPIWEQYLIWVGFAPGPNGFSGLLQGDYGWSFEFDRPVSDIVGGALWLTVLVNLAAVLFVYMVALPLGGQCQIKPICWFCRRSERLSSDIIPCLLDDHQTARRESSRNSSPNSNRWI
jgi:peptide/nickel transport system permease protein